MPAPAGLIVDAVEQQPPVVQPPAAATPPPAATQPTASTPPAAPATHHYERPQGQRQDDFQRDSRGRRRRRHGRHFGERKFGPKPEFRDHPAERPDSSARSHPAPESGPSHAFEVLPGESLAKYKHSSVPHSEQTALSAEPTEHQAAIPPTADEGHLAESAPVVAETPHASLTVEPESQSTVAKIEVAPPRVEAEASHEHVRAEPAPEVQPEPWAVSEPSIELAREVAPGLTPAGAPHSGEALTGDSTAASEPENIEIEEMSPPPSSEFEAAPAESSEPFVTEPQTESKPRPLWDRLVSSVLGREAGTSGASAEELPVEAAAPPAYSPVDEGAEIPPSSDAQEPSASSEIEAAMPEAGEIGESEATEPGQSAPEAPVADQPADRGSAPHREYTLREPYQRPRFSPRRRGRFGRGRDSNSGGQGPRREAPRSGNHHPVQIAEVLKEGQEILVQIAKEPLGTKGARITSHVALPGRYLVYMPTIDHIGVSRKIASEEERLRLRNIILENKGSLTGGFIVRTAGQGRSEEEFKADLKFLSTLWSEIRAKSDRLKAPALIHRDLDLVQRLLRDLLTPDFKCVRVDSEIDYERVLDFVNRCQPALVGKVKLYSRDTPLYEEFGIQAEIDKALKPKVWLKSGGYIVINQTEALVAIDVNTGKYVGKTNRLEDTIVKTNVDAVNEIVRQVRLRDLGGIIVIDFIDMDERKNRAKVVQALEEALRSDRAPTKVISFNDFGLVAVTRKRVKQSLERTLCEPCSYCTGSGWVKSVNTVCNEILAEARKMAKGIDGNVLTLRVNPEVAKALKSREGGLVSELESLTKKDVIIKSDPNVHQERFEIYSGVRSQESESPDECCRRLAAQACQPTDFTAQLQPQCAQALPNRRLPPPGCANDKTRP